MSIREVHSQESNSPERKKQIQPDQAEKFKKLTKIEKVDDIDEDKKGKRQKRGGEEEEVTSIKKTEALLGLTKREKPKMKTDCFGRKLSFKSGYGSPVPSTTPSPAFSNKTDPTEDLPSSDGFWQSAPLNNPEKPKKIQEVTEPNNSHQKASAKSSPKTAEEELLLEAKKLTSSSKKGIKGKNPFEVSSKKEPSPKTSEKEKTEKTQPITLPEKRASHLEKEQEKLSLPEKTVSKKTVSEPVPQEEKSTHSKKRKTTPKKSQEKTALKHIADNFAPMLVLPSKKEEAQLQKEKNKENLSDNLVEPVKIPAEIAAQGIAATTHLPSYVSPQVQNLFAQMVSTVVVMQQKGITTTQVELNSPYFEKSIFRGAVISIDRYSTAPGSFNIRLSGSPEAVQLFEKNIPTLQAAFERGRFSFRVSRLESSLKGEKHLIQRKSSSKETKGDS